MESNPDTLSVSKRIRAVYSGYRYSQIPISCFTHSLKDKFQDISVRNQGLVSDPLFTETM